MTDSTIIIRADGGETIGMGHVMRCIGLAQALVRTDARVVFVAASHCDAVASRIRAEGFEYLCTNVRIGSDDDAAQLRKLHAERRPDLILIDGYYFTGEWLAKLGSLGCPTMLWTDFVQSPSLPVDVILDQNPSASVEMYRKAAPGARVLAGLDFAVLRREFLNRPGFRRPRTSVEHVLIAMGGADPLNLTPRIVEEVAGARREAGVDFAIDVVVGPASTCGATVDRVAGELDDCTVHRAVSDMGAIIQRADIAVSAAGISLWEYAYSGLPTLAIAVAENQAPLARCLGASGGGVDLGRAEDLHGDGLRAELVELTNSDQLDRRSSQMLALVDGGGAMRVVEAIQLLVGSADHGNRARPSPASAERTAS